MLSKSFKPAKCKTSLKLAVARMKLLKNKRDVQLKQMKRDLAQLLDSGQEQTARIRVEHVVREEKTMAAYEIIAIYCELIVARLPIIESQKNCPIDLKEAIASVIFATPRCADVPELKDIRKHLTAKYGKDFAAAALELRPDCGVSRMVVEKLSATTPDGETKIKILTAIAKEHNVNWDPQALQEEIAKPAEDLLKVPSRPENSSKTFVESSNIQYHNSEGQFKLSNEQFLARPSQKLDPSSTFAGSDGIRSSPGPSTFSSLDSKPPSFSVHSSYSQEGFTGHSKSADGDNWNMRFKDATSAAQAAAESAELASLAARAAAELSSRGKHTNDHSRIVTDSPYDMTKDEVSPSTRNSKSSYTQSSFKKNGDSEVYHEGDISKRSDQHRDETYWSNYSDGSDNRYDAMQNRSSSLKKSGLSSPADILSSDEVSPTTRNSKSSSTRSSFKESGVVGEVLKKNDQERDGTSWYNLSHGGESRSDVMQSRNSSVKGSVLSQPADMFSNDYAPVIDLLKAGGNIRDTSSGSNRNDIGSPDSTMNFVGVNSSPCLDIKDYESDIFGENSRGTFGESSFDRRSKRLSNDYSAVVFDDSGSEGDEKLDLDVDGTGRFPADVSTDKGYSLSHPGSWNFKEQNASPDKDNSTDNSRIIGANHTTENSVELLRNSDQPQQSDFPAATFDDSDGLLNTSSDDEVDIHKLEERNKSSSYSYKLDRSEQLALSAGSVHEPIKSENENRQFKEAHRNIHGPYSRDASDLKNDAVDVGFKEDYVKPLRKHDSGNILRERTHFEDTKGIDNLAVDEHPTTSLPSPSAGKTFDTLGVDKRDKVSDEMKVLNFSSDENEMRLNFGRLTGGLRHKNFIQPPYVKHPSKQRTTDVVVSQSVGYGGRIPESSKAPSMELPSEKSHEEVVRETKQETAYKTSVENQAVDFGERTPKYSKAPVAQLSRENSLKDVNVESRQGATDKTFVESQTVNFGGRTPRYTKSPVLELPSEKSREDIVKEPKAKKALNFFDSDSSDDDRKQESPKTVNSKTYNDNAYSRRTKTLPSKTGAGSSSRFTSHFRTQHENSGEASSTSDRKTNVVRSKGGGIRSREGVFSVEQSSMPLSSEDPSLMVKERVNPQPETPKQGAPKSSKLSSLIGESSSVDDSPKIAGHVHPKLPDYDTLAARIQSLTSNKR